MHVASKLGDAVAASGRPARNAVDPSRPYAFLVEPEPGPDHTVEDVATVFLTNRECPFRCVFCDLWKNTTEHRVPVGAIPGQIDYALARLPRAQHIKLYNSGNFFDPQAIPPEDFPAIAERVAGFRTVIVENHPNLCGEACLEFRDLLRSGSLEIAMGLETAHPGVLPLLNKRMTLDDFRRAAEFLTSNGIAVRAFVLLKPPFMEEAECVDWAVRSLEFAFDCGARVCAIIPTRGGNGTLEQLAREGKFAPPRFESLETALEAGMRMGRGRVLADLWDAERFLGCPQCGPRRVERLRAMNLQQKLLPVIECRCRTPSGSQAPLGNPDS